MSKTITITIDSKNAMAPARKLGRAFKAFWTTLRDSKPVDPAVTACGESCTCKDPG